MKSCKNCRHRMFHGWDGMPECCYGYEVADTDEQMIEEAKDCQKYEEGDPFEDEYEDTPSATRRDYGPSNPWDAPGMSVRDFI